MNLRLRAAAAIVLVFLSGCVSVFVDSVPEGATVYVDGERIADTPSKFKAKTFIWLSYDVVVHKDGFEDFRERVDAEFDPYMLVLILSPLIVLIPFLGSVEPRHVVAQMKPLGAAPPPGPVPLSAPR